jgi:hypothetical protein
MKVPAYLRRISGKTLLDKMKNDIRRSCKIQGINESAKNRMKDNKLKIVKDKSSIGVRAPSI